MQTVTPIIKKTRVKAERYEVCPHCRQEIHEKSTYIDDDNYIYHRPCMEKGPIDQITQKRMDQALKCINPDWANSLGKAAQIANVSTHAGSFEKNVAGKSYEIEWRANLPLDGTRAPDDVTTDKPADMPEYLWYQVKDAFQIDAVNAALAAQKASNIVRPVVQASTWLERSASDETEIKSIGSKHFTMRMKPQKNPTKSIDSVLLADGLGAFLDAFVNYHSREKGPMLAKWMLAICEDPKYKSAAKKLEELHKLIGEIYSDVLDVAKADEDTTEKAASVFSKLIKRQNNG